MHLVTPIFFLHPLVHSAFSPLEFKPPAVRLKHAHTQIKLVELSKRVPVGILLCCSSGFLALWSLVEPQRLGREEKSNRKEI